MTAKWICHPQDNRDTRLIPIFRKYFIVGSGLRKANLKMTAHGIYEAEMNGIPVTKDKFTPGFTSYYHRIQFQEYDVTELLHTGENLWQTTVGDGWWRWNNNFGSRLALWGELTLIYEDHTENVVTDTDFCAGTGAIIKSDLRMGEIYDAGNKVQVWEQAAVETEHTEAEMVSTEGVAVREKEVFHCRCFLDNAGNMVLDFGQNIAGYVRMRLRDTEPGEKIHLKHGEGLNPDGIFSTANCDGGMTPFQEITYYCRGSKIEEYTPHFAVFGFRYVMLEGYCMDKIQDGDFVSIAVYSDMKQTGGFACSNPLINKLVENSLWSQKGNFLDVAVDCPTRERNAWTGDAQIYCRTSAYFMDVYSFFEKWLKDQTIEQYASGKVGITFPSTSSVHDSEELQRIKKQDPYAALAGPIGNGNIGEDSVGWGDSAVWIPCQLYLMYGNKKILENQYDTSKRWVEYSLSCMREKNPLYADKPWYIHGDGDFIYDTKFHYGEWKEPLPPSPETISFFQSGRSPEEYVEFMAQFGKPEVATAYTKRSCDNLAMMAEILEKNEDARYYRKISEKIKKAYDRYMIADDGTIQQGHQAAYVRALALNLAGEEKKPLVVRQLKKEIAAADYHLNTGFLSTVYLLPTLCDYGMEEEAFRILEQTTAPGWLYPVSHGATTMPENWNGLDLFQDSFNHYSFGAVCQFLFEYVAGIRPCFEKPGFRKFQLKPVMGGTLTHVSAYYESVFGMILSSWEKKNSAYIYRCTVPKGTEAVLILPDGKRDRLCEGDYEFQGKI